MEDRKISNNLAYALKLRRKEAGVSVKEVASKLEVNPNTVYAWESGQNVPSCEIFIELCDMYHADICDFIVNTNEVPKRIEVSAEEADFLELYRNATPESRESVLMVLKCNQRVKKEAAV